MSWPSHADSCRHQRRCRNARIGTTPRHATTATPPRAGAPFAANQRLSRFRREHARATPRRPKCREPGRPHLPRSGGIWALVPNPADVIDALIAQFASTSPGWYEDLLLGSTPVETARSRETVKRAGDSRLADAIGDAAGYGYCASHSRYAAVRRSSRRRRVRARRARDARSATSSPASRSAGSAQPTASSPSAPSSPLTNATCSKRSVSPNHHDSAPSPPRRPSSRRHTPRQDRSVSCRRPLRHCIRNGTPRVAQGTAAPTSRVRSAAVVFASRT